ncbi:hypothetical protein [Leifsonia sp. LS-T14]|uniref:hypothetical protein n=1 Tax=unclassified Leifsonia TaxID=2663824 RepID=UPI0035A69830
MAAVLCTAATAGVLAWLTFLIGQALSPTSSATNIGLYEGHALLAAVIATALGVVGGLFAAAGGLVGLLIARTTNISALRGCALVGLCSAFGALGSYAFVRPNAAGWAIAAVGALVVGLSVFGFASRFVRGDAARTR